MTKPLTITYLDKTNPNPITDRTKQSTAEDWIEVKTVVNNLSGLLHIESKDEALTAALTHTITFDGDYPDTGYCFIKMVVYRIEADGGYTELPFKDRVPAVGSFTFGTYTSEDLRIDYFIMGRQS